MLFLSTLKLGFNYYILRLMINDTRVTYLSFGHKLSFSALNPNISPHKKSLTFEEYAQVK